MGFGPFGSYKSLISVGTVGSKGIAGVERSGEASGIGPWPASEEAGCCDSKVHASTRPSSGQGQGSPCQDVYRGVGCAATT